MGNEKTKLVRYTEEELQMLITALDSIRVRPEYEELRKRTQEKTLKAFKDPQELTLLNGGK